MRNEAETDTVISLEYRWILETQPPDPIGSVIQELFLCSSTRNVLGFSGSRELKPKRASLSLVGDSDLLKNLAALDMEMEEKPVIHVHHSLCDHMLTHS